MDKFDKKIKEIEKENKKQFKKETIRVLIFAFISILMMSWGIASCEKIIASKGGLEQITIDIGRDVKHVLNEIKKD